MSHISHSTALALKEAGLPQPLPAPGQLWYLPSLGIPIGGFLPHIINGLQGDGAYVSCIGKVLFGEEYVGLFLKEWPDDATFAPGIDDLLPILGDSATVIFRKDYSGQVFECNIDEGDGIMEMLAHHEFSAVEAVALAVLDRLRAGA